MDCRRCEELIHSLLDGDISEEERKQLNKHADKCPECMAKLNALKRQTLFLGSLRPKCAGVDMGRLRQEKAKRQAAAGRKAFAWVGACAAALVVCVLSVSLFASKGSARIAGETAADMASGAYEAAEYAAEPVEEPCEAYQEESVADDAPADAPEAEPGADSPPALESGSAQDASSEEFACETGVLYVNAQTAARLADKLEKAGFSVCRYDGGDFSVYIEADSMENAAAAFEEEGLFPKIYADCDMYVGIE